MDKVKILGIAPYDGIKYLMEQAASQRNDIDLQAFVGDLEAGAAIASHYSAQDFDIVISRGGTAELIRQKTAFPVVDIPISIYDIFRSIKLAENYTSSYALIGFPNITKNAHFLCDMLRYNISIYTIHTEGEAASILQKLAAENCHTILCDMITNSLARKFGLTSILITSGSESVESSFDFAVDMARSLKKQQTNLSFYRSVLSHCPYTAVVYTPQGEPVFFSRPDGISTYITEQLKHHLPAVLEDGEKKIYCEYKGLLYIFHGYRMSVEEQTYVCYYINQRKLPLALTKNGVRYITKEEAFDDYYKSFYGITHASAALQETIDQYSAISQPLVILGEIGTGKHQLAKLLYAKSPLSTKPMAIIDCARINEKSWSFLTEHTNSPLSDINTTIFIHGTESLTDQKFAELLSILSELNLTLRNRMIVTFNYDSSGGISPRCQKLLNTFSCLTMEIPCLREHREEIPNLASLYISALNVQLSKEVIGLEPEALRLLQAYDWPYNYDQFKRIINALVSTAKKPYITANAVSQLLRQELPEQPAQHSSLNLNRTLEEINLEILHLVLAQEQGNQSAAAKRLGISRTTLWRMLQKTPLQ